jgi:exodeoxyribonuclease VII small subunit
MTDAPRDQDRPASTPDQDPARVDPPSYEEARDELIAVVQRLETGGTSLQESIALWERGEELAKICQRWLDGARARLDAVLADTKDGEHRRG